MDIFARGHTHRDTINFSEQRSYYYDGAFTIMDAQALRAVVAGFAAYRIDMRPFEVVFRYLEQMSYQLGRTETGGVCLVYEHNGRRHAKNTSVSRVLYLCRDRAREAQGAADSAYKRMCAEEDEEELELLLELGRNMRLANRPHHNELRRNKEDNVIPLTFDIHKRQEEDWHTARLQQVLPEKAVAGGMREELAPIPPHMMF